MPVNASGRSMLIMAVTQALVCLVLVGGVVYALATGSEVSGDLIKLLLLVLGAYFGFSSKVYSEHVRNSRGR